MLIYTSISYSVLTRVTLICCGCVVQLFLTVVLQFSTRFRLTQRVAVAELLVYCFRPVGNGGHSFLTPLLQFVVDVLYRVGQKSGATHS